MLGRSWVGSGSADASEIEISLLENYEDETQIWKCKLREKGRTPLHTMATRDSVTNGALTRAGACRSSSGPHRVLTLRFVRFEECTDSRSAKQPGLAGEKRHVGIGFAIFFFLSASDRVSTADGHWKFCTRMSVA